MGQFSAVTHTICKPARYHNMCMHRQDGWGSTYKTRDDSSRCDVHEGEKKREKREKEKGNCPARLSALRTFFSSGFRSASECQDHQSLGKLGGIR